MNILVTGSKGFVGKNLCATLKNIANGYDRSFGEIEIDNIYEFDTDTDVEKLKSYCKDCDFVFHLAGVNRPENEAEYMSGNFGFTSVLLETLKSCGNTCPVMLSSSVQADLDNPYGLSKKAGEDLLIKYGEESGARVLIYRFTNIFGKWCRPNYNSAVATFCNNIAHGLPITVRDTSINMTLVYIDDVVAELINALKGEPNGEGDYYTTETQYKITLGEIADMLYRFKEDREKLNVPDGRDGFEKKLYATYLSYLPEDGFSYPLKKNEDERGSFTEIIRSAERGQFSVNISKPGITKGNHWHNTKNEKFVVVSGKGIIRFRKIGDDKVYEYFVSGEKPEVVDIPTGYTHNIENLGETDMVTFMWCNECFNPDRPDTYFEKV